MKLIPLTRGMFAKVSDRDYAPLSKHKWCVSVQGKRGKLYACRSSGRRGKILMHHEILKKKPGLDVDHRNNDGLDNQRRNLRYRTRSQNVHAARSDAHALTGIRERKGRFMASIMIDYVRHRKTFDTAEAAQAWRRSIKP